MIVAAIDTGATKIAGAALDEQGRILRKLRYPNTGASGPTILEIYARIVEELQQSYEISAIGIGAGGRIDPVAGKVLYAVNIYTDYIGLPIGRWMEDRFHLPVAVDNDCRNAVCGEHWLGAARGYNNVFGIILGTGLGGGLIVNGCPVHGASHSAGEIGHMVLYPGGKQCGCGQLGCTEQYVSGTALWQNYNQAAGEEVLASGYDFFERLDAGDPAAAGVMERFNQDLSNCTISVLNLFSPDAVLFGGGLMDTAYRWWDSFSATCRERMSPYFSNIPLLRSSSGNDAALQGAARLALQKAGGLPDDGSR